MSEAQLEVAVALGPVAVAIEVGRLDPALGGGAFTEALHGQCAADVRQSGECSSGPVGRYLTCSG